MLLPENIFQRFFVGNEATLRTVAPFLAATMLRIHKNIEKTESHEVLFAGRVTNGSYAVANL